jgi:hypothetical protein
MVMKRQVCAPRLVNDQRLAAAWQISAIAVWSAAVPWGVGLTTSAAAASGY